MVERASSVCPGAVLPKQFIKQHAPSSSWTLSNWINGVMAFHLRGFTFILKILDIISHIADVGCIQFTIYHSSTTFKNTYIYLCIHIYLSCKEQLSGCSIPGNGGSPCVAYIPFAASVTLPGLEAKLLQCPRFSCHLEAKGKILSFRILP